MCATGKCGSEEAREPSAGGEGARECETDEEKDEKEEEEEETDACRESGSFEGSGADTTRRNSALSNAEV